MRALSYEAKYIEVILRYVKVLIIKRIVIAIKELI